MTPNEQFNSIVMLIDAENTSPGKLGDIVGDLSQRGRVTVRRAYGDWGNGALRKWRDPLVRLAIQPVQQFSWTNGKNASDICMVIDAMDLLHSGKHDAFALVTSDSDFTRLACRLREGQVCVFGIGRSQTPASFKSACDVFVTIKPSNGKGASQPPARAGTSNNGSSLLRDPEMLKEVSRLLEIAAEQHADDDGWTCVSRAGNVIKREHPDFTPRVCGKRKLSDVVALLSDEFEMQRTPRGNGHANLYRRLPPDLNE